MFLFVFFVCLVYLCNSVDLYEHSYPVFVKDFLDFDYYNLKKIESENKRSFLLSLFPISVYRVSALFVLFILL